jgi:hypothetical protein
MGTGEVTGYLGTHGSAGVSKAALIRPIPPHLLRTDDNPRGVPLALGLPANRGQSAAQGRRAQCCL